MLSTVPTLVEARLAAAAHGVELIFEPGRGSSGDTTRLSFLYRVPLEPG